MKKSILYIGIALISGLFLGWLLFSNSINTSANSEIKSAHPHTHSSKWTCSMHPQIMQQESGDCPICGMDLIPTQSNADGLSPNEIKMTKNAMALANIQTSIIGSNSSFKSKDGEILLSGKIGINKDKTAIQPAHFNGRIEKLYITSLGEKVTKRQAIAKIYSPDLVAAQQELITAHQLKESQPQLYKAVHTKFKNWKIHDTQLEEVLRTGKAKTSFTIYSHVSGIVTNISVSDGAHIMDGHPIFKVSNLNSVWANFDIYENQMAQFKKGQEIKITSEAYPNKIFNASVAFIDPILDTQTRTVTLRAVLDNKKSFLKPGMFVSGKINTNNTIVKKQITIPTSAVLWTGKRSLVYIKTKPNEPIFEMREVTLGNRSKDAYQILSGLENGDEIVTNGTFTVDAAAQLQGKKSMMNK